MNEPRSKVNANKLLDELLKTTSSCYGCLGKTEEWSGVEVNEVKNELEKASKNVDTMEQFDFDKVVERRGTDCVKWDTLPDDEVLPLWVADMDFEVAPCIRQAIAERAAHGVYGYTLRTEAYNEALINWFQRPPFFRTLYT